MTTSKILKSEGQMNPMNNSEGLDPQKGYTFTHTFYYSQGSKQATLFRSHTIVSSWDITLYLGNIIIAQGSPVKAF